jgi:hypothetical protein
MQKINFIINGKKSSKHTIILAHSAGESMSSEFMNYFSENLSDIGFYCIRFQFPFMTKQVKEEKKYPPDKLQILVNTWNSVLKIFDRKKIIIGGKSMGGRVATLIADSQNVNGVIALGYPFISTTGNIKNRIEHLKNIKTPTLICQGENDKLGKKEFIDKLQLSKNIKLHWIKESNHSLVPLKRSGKTSKECWNECIIEIKNFVINLS